MVSGFFALLLVALAAATASSSSLFTVMYDASSEAYSVVPGKDQYNGVAYCEVEDSRDANGWIRLNVFSNAEYADDIQMYGAGFLEGYVTASPIWQNWINTVNNTWGGHGPSQFIQNFLTQNYAFAKSLAAKNPADPYNAALGSLLAQLDGLVAGYNNASTADRKLTLLDFLVLNADGDLETLGLFPNQSATFFKRGGGGGGAVGMGTHCSALIKLTPDNGELFAGHSTWSSFYEMLRIYKKYSFPLQNPAVRATDVMMSSYPGFLSSVDDFYTTIPSKLTVIETTNGIMNLKLLDKVTPNSVLSWMRVMIATRIAAGAEDWVEVFSRYNSGTYNNQWIVVDYKRFQPFQSLPDNVLWIAEQIPGLVRSIDATPYLRNGHWPSYNIPFFEDIFEMSDFAKYVEMYGNWFTYDLTPRSQIFRRDAGKVATLDDFKAIMRYNNWKNDPLSYGSAGNAISSRMDLCAPNDPNPFLRKDAFGAIDSKVTSHALMAAGGVAHAQSGPTHDDLPPFSWASWSGISILGLPEVWNFGWVSFPSGISV